MDGYLHCRHVLLNVPEPEVQQCFERHAYLKGVVPAHALKRKCGCLVGVCLVTFLLPSIEILND